MWTKLKEYGALYEAEMDQTLLENSGVEVLLQGPVTGIFGPGFAGATAQGVVLLVQDTDAERARELLQDTEAE